MVAVWLPILVLKGVAGRRGILAQILAHSLDCLAVRYIEGARRRAQ